MIMGPNAKREPPLDLSLVSPSVSKPYLDGNLPLLARSPFKIGAEFKTSQWNHCTPSVSTPSSRSVIIGLIGHNLILTTVPTTCAVAPCPQGEPPRS